MIAALLRTFVMLVSSVSLLAHAQDTNSVASQNAQTPASIYEASRLDVTVPLATGENGFNNEANAVSLPLENIATPMRCMAAWSYLAAGTIRSPDDAKAKHPDFTEAIASSHWQHWLKADLDEHQGRISDDFHQRRLAAERTFNTNLNDQGEGHAYRTLGTCYIPPADREVADPTVLLRNFMIEHQGLPTDYRVPVLQRQLRAFPVTETVESDSGDPCDAQGRVLASDISLAMKTRCFDRGGILASLPKVSVEDLGDLCRISGTVQCENIP